MKRIATAVVILLGWLGAPSASQACGGFFCDNAAPVIQLGEQIVFGVDGDKIDAHIRISYGGPASDFSWVLPLPEVPTVSISDEWLFSTLATTTQPTFRSEWKQSEDEDCQIEDWQFGFVDATDGADGGDGADSTDGTAQSGGVNVLASGQAGPYDYHVVEAAEGADADALFSWLSENGYEQPEMTEPLVSTYSAMGFKFVAIKLQPGKATGDIRPVRLQYESPVYACVPLRLTSLAAGEDMPITLWVYAKARSVPMNYLHVTLNPAAYDWVRCGTATGELFNFGRASATGGCNYMDLVGDAVDQAGGRAFVTEFAGDNAMETAEVFPGIAEAVAALADSTADSDYAWLQELMTAVQFSPSLVEVLRDADLLKATNNWPCDTAAPNSWWWLDNCLEEDVTVDRAAILESTQTFVVEPLLAVREVMTSHPYLTRMTTTMSPHEMVIDPMFSFNADLPPVSNISQATITPLCADGEVEAVKVELPGGGTQVVYGSVSFGFVPSEDSTEGQSPAGSIQVMDESGVPSIITEADVPREQLRIEGRGPTRGQSDVEANPEPTETDTPSGTFGTVEPRQEQFNPSTTSGTTAKASSDGCTAGTHSSSGAGFALVFLFTGAAAIVLRRRRAQG